MTATTNQWMQFYQQPLMDDLEKLQVSAMEGFSDVTAVTTSSSSVLSPSSSYTSPTAINNVSKPIRRRSRASKRTPTTLLNANTTNFRALVQQFTGCPSLTSMSFGIHKGPITLNFQQGRKQQVRHNVARSPLTMAAPAPAPPAPFGNTSYSSQGHQLQLADQQQLLQDQSVHNNLFEYSTDHFPSNSGNSSKSGMEQSDHGLLVDHNYSLHDQTMNNSAFFSNDMIIKNDGYFMG